MLQLLSLFISVLTVWSMWRAGSARPAWGLTLVNQVAWLVYILLTKQWGLLLMNVALWVVFTRNFIVWRAAKALR